MYTPNPTRTLQGIRTSHDEFRFADGRPGFRAREVFSSLSTGVVGQDCTGHGTHVAASVGGLTFGAAKNSSLLAVRSLDCNTDSDGSSDITGVTQASSLASFTWGPTRVHTRGHTGSPTRGVTRGLTRGHTRGHTRGPTRGPTQEDTRGPTRGRTKEDTRGCTGVTQG